LFLHRTRNWVYKWIKRGQSQEPEWYLSKSTKPKTSPNRVLPEIEKEVVHSRQHLQRRDTMATKYAFCGAIGVHQELERKGINDKPSLSTINRIIKRHGLIEGPSQKRDINKRKIYYPTPIARHPGYLHQVDLVTPLYITGYGKIVSVNRIDVFTSKANVKPFDAKNTDNIISFLIEDWKAFGIPRYLQVDNEGAFRGGLYHPRSFGKLIRFCLNFGVQIIFIPFSEPWRNGHIESLNGRYQKLVWQRHRFKDLNHLHIESVKFCKQHNGYQTYRTQHFKSVSQRGYTQTFLPTKFSFDATIKLPITTGLVHFIRQVNENGVVSILNEEFSIDKKHCFEYIWAVINTRKQSLSIFYKESKTGKKELIDKLNYKIREKVKNRIPIDSFNKPMFTMS